MSSEAGTHLERGCSHASATTSQHGGGDELSDGHCSVRLSAGRHIALKRTIYTSRSRLVEPVSRETHSLKGENGSCPLRRPTTKRAANRGRTLRLAGRIPLAPALNHLRADVAMAKLTQACLLAPGKGRAERHRQIDFRKAQVTKPNWSMCCLRPLFLVPVLCEDAT